MSEMDIALLCKTLSDANRLKIVQMLADGEKCACKLLEAFSITQPTLSHHMKILCEAGLVDARREGRWSHYSLNRQTLSLFQAFIAALACDAPCENKEGCSCK